MRYILILIISMLMFASCGTKNTKTEETKEVETVKLEDVVTIDIIGKYTILELDGESLRDHDFGDQMPLMAFDDENKVYSTNIGCNQISGKYEVDGAKIRILPGMSTMMACTDDMENKYLRALSEVDNYKIDDFKLNLYRGEELIIVYLPTRR